MEKKKEKWREKAEEIGKLIKLLNEYDGDVLEYGFVDGDIRRKVKNFDNERNTWKSVVWYTKQFGFIKWLVENDKIDIDKLKFQSDFMFPLWKDFDQMGSEDIEEYSEYESLLMLLSISDTPIEDLISYLK